MPESNKQATNKGSNRHVNCTKHLHPIVYNSPLSCILNERGGGSASVRPANAIHHACRLMISERSSGNTSSTTSAMPYGRVGGLRCFVHNVVSNGEASLDDRIVMGTVDLKIMIINCSHKAA